MIDIKLISFGKENAITKESLMRICRIKNDNDFRKGLAELRKNYIILSSSEHKGYWRPNSKEEYNSFILEQESRLNDIQELLDIAKKEFKNRSKCL